MWRWSVREALRYIYISVFCAILFIEQNRTDLFRFAANITSTANIHIFRSQYREYNIVFRLQKSYWHNHFYFLYIYNMYSDSNMYINKYTHKLESVVIAVAFHSNTHVPTHMSVVKARACMRVFNLKIGKCRKVNQLMCLECGGDVTNTGCVLCVSITGEGNSLDGHGLSGIYIYTCIYTHIYIYTRHTVKPF